MNTTDNNIMDPDDAINCPGNNEANDHFIYDLFDDEGAFGEADCAGL